VIDYDFNNDINKVLEEEGYKFIDMKILGKNKSHFIKGKNEILIIHRR
jgi:hypothetical protein